MWEIFSNSTFVFRVSSMTNFWRKAALNSKKEGKPQSESDPGRHSPKNLKIIMSCNFQNGWKSIKRISSAPNEKPLKISLWVLLLSLGIRPFFDLDIKHNTSPNSDISQQVGQLELVEKEATPEKPKQMGNREKMRRKEENWEVVFI